MSTPSSTPRRRTAAAAPALGLGLRPPGSRCRRAVVVSRRRAGPPASPTAQRADQRLGAQLHQPRRLGHLLDRPDQHRPGRLRHDRRLHHRHPLDPLRALLLALPAALGAGRGRVGAAIGWPILRLRGVYFAMVTLSLTEAVRLPSSTAASSPRAPPASSTSRAPAGIDSPVAFYVLAARASCSASPRSGGSPTAASAGCSARCGRTRSWPPRSASTSRASA